MAFFRRLFSGVNGHTPLNKTYTIKLQSDDAASAVYVNAAEHPANVLRLLGLHTQARPAIFITGGAGNMTDKDKALTREMFEKGIAPFAEKHQIVVIDGATQSGVIEMMATARYKQKYTFPLIGIAPFKKVSYPGKYSSDGAALCRGHSHFVLVTGDDFGAESKMIIDMTHVLAGGRLNYSERRVPAVGVVVNGGQIARQEAYLATRQNHDMPLVVLEGSGRFADELASAARTGETSQALLRAIISHGNVHLVSTTSGPRAMQEKLSAAFSAKGSK